MKEGHAFSIFQGGLEVASGHGPMKEVIREAQHYAFIYRQDGPVEIYIDGKEVKNDH